MNFDFFKFLIIQNSYVFIRNEKNLQFYVRLNQIRKNSNYLIISKKKFIQSKIKNLKKIKTF